MGRLDRTIRVAVWALVMGWPAVACGWGRIGHDAVAYIAECNLSPKAQRIAEKYLGHSIVYGLIWNSENYYLVAYDISNQEMRHYRVDKMAEIVVTGLPREGEDRYPDFDVAAYGQKHFGMYSGEEASVTLRCRSHMAGVVWDRFGQDVILVPEDEDHFTVTLPLVLSPQFFGWLFGLEDNVELIAPQKAAEEYRRKLKAVLEQYG